MNVKRPTLWLALLLGFVGCVTSFGAHIVAVNLPYYAESVGIGLATIGLLIAAYDLAEIVAKPVFGKLADSQGMKRTMLIGILIFIAASLLYLVVSAKLLILVRFLQGLGAAALSAVSLTLVGVYYKENRGRAYGIYNAVKGLGYVVSPVVGGLIVLNSHFGALFLATAGIGAVAFLLSLLLPKPIETPGEVFDDDDFSLKGFFAVFKEPALWPWYVVTVVNMFLVGILFGFAPVRIHTLGYTPVVAGAFLTIITVSYLAIQPVAGMLADRLKPAVTIRAGLVLAALSVIAFPFFQGIPLGLLCVLGGVGVGTVWTNTDAHISTLAREGRLGATMGAAGSFKEFGDMVGPLLIGVLSQAFGLTAGFVSCGVLAFLCLLFIARTKDSAHVEQR